ncbi:MAG: Ada metal-binding domain-containing protein [Nanoarchaeota archaeon]|nr:Ada metal-binding domain-containing protein [Nanoarchaeota archaeon]
MNTIEQNIMNSFRLAKNDIMGLQRDVIELQEALASSLKSKQKTVIVNHTAHKDFVAVKEGKIFHVSSCPFAKNIQPQNKKAFTSRTQALNSGMRPCRCVA